MSGAMGLSKDVETTVKDLGSQDISTIAGSADGPRDADEGDCSQQVLSISTTGDGIDDPHTPQSGPDDQDKGGMTLLSDGRPQLQ